MDKARELELAEKLVEAKRAGSREAWDRAFEDMKREIYATGISWGVADWDDIRDFFTLKVKPLAALSRPQPSDDELVERVARAISRTVNPWDAAGDQWEGYVDEARAALLALPPAPMEECKLGEHTPDGWASRQHDWMIDIFGAALCSRCRRRLSVDAARQAGLTREAPDDVVEVLRYVRTAFPILASMCGAAGLTAGEAKANEMDKELAALLARLEAKQEGGV